MKTFVVAIAIFICTVAFGAPSGGVSVNSTDSVGISVRVNSTLIPIPVGFVIESVNVRQVDDHEIEEIRFISGNEDAILRLIKVYRLRSLNKPAIFPLTNLIQLGDQASMTECDFGEYEILRADYQGFPEFTKVAITEDNYQVLLIGEASPLSATTLLEEVEQFESDGRRSERLGELATCLAGGD